MDSPKELLLINASIISHKILYVKNDVKFQKLHCFTRIFFVSHLCTYTHILYTINPQVIHNFYYINILYTIFFLREWNSINSILITKYFAKSLLYKEIAHFFKSFDILYYIFMYLRYLNKLKEKNNLVKNREFYTNLSTIYAQVVWGSVKDLAQRNFAVFINCKN